MILPLDQFSPGKVYFQMVQTVLPRPIAWVLSVNATGSYNLAPFSYFNAVCSDPPLLMLSIGKKPDGSDKDTHRNIAARNYFTIHIADLADLEALNQSSATLPANASELDALDLKITDFEGASVPRIQSCKIAFACELHEIHQIGNLPQTVIYGKVNAIYIDDSIATVSNSGRIKVNVDQFEPVSRLGAGEYMRAGEIIRLARPE